jgi:hypothetical protein
MLAPLAAGLAVFVPLAVFMRATQQEAIQQGVAAMQTDPDVTRRIAQVRSAVAALKLITVEIDTTVQVSRGDENWRGSIQATVEVPVRLRYGVNLAEIGKDDVVHSTLGGGPAGLLVISLPQPTLLGTEVFTEHERTSIISKGIRFKSMSGEHFLGLARRDAAAAARALLLRPEDAARVRDITVKQVQELVHRFFGSDIETQVRFAFEASAP